MALEGQKLVRRGVGEEIAEGLEAVEALWRRPASSRREGCVEEEAVQERLWRNIGWRKTGSRNPSNWRSLEKERI